MVEVNLHMADPNRAKALELALQWHQGLIATGQASPNYNAAAARKITEIARVFHDFLKQT